MNNNIFTSLWDGGQLLKEEDKAGQEEEEEGREAGEDDVLSTPIFM